MVVTPSAIAPNNSDRWEIDLAPGTRTVPESPPPARSSRDDEAVLVTLNGCGPDQIDLMGKRLSLFPICFCAV